MVLKQVPTRLNTTHTSKDSKEKESLKVGLTFLTINIEIKTVPLGGTTPLSHERIGSPLTVVGRLT